MDDIQMASRRREVRLMRRALFQFDLHRFTFIMQMCAVHLVHQIHRRIVITSSYEYPILARKRERERETRTVRKFVRPSTRLFVHFTNRRQRGLVADRFATEALRFLRAETHAGTRATYSSSPTGRKEKENIIARFARHA